MGTTCLAHYTHAADYIDAGITQHCVKMQVELIYRSGNLYEAWNIDSSIMHTHIIYTLFSVILKCMNV